MSSLRSCWRWPQPTYAYPGMGALPNDSSFLGSRNVIAHELAHAFQSGLVGHAVFDNWLVEATAEYYAAEVDSDPYFRNERDNDFLGKPHVPLESFRGLGEERRHEYGAFRFVHWLDTQMPPRTVDRWITATLRELGPAGSVSGLDVTEAAARNFAAVGGTGAAGEDLIADGLPRFWGEHLVETELNRRAGTGRTMHLARAVVPAPSPQTFVHGIVFPDSRPHAVVGARVVLDPGVRQVEVSVIAQPGTRVWMLEGERDTTPRRVTATQAAPERTIYCVGQPGTDQRRWPGELRFAITNITRDRIVRGGGVGASVITNTNPDRTPRSLNCPDGT